MSTPEELHSERDFLMKSLDDLELEHESGGIDDESYQALHDDYTARAAATIRALRDGVDARPAPPAVPPTKRRAAVIAGILVFAVIVGLALAGTLGVRLPGQTSSGNAPSSDAAASAKVGRAITSLQQQVNASPDDYDLRLQLAEAYASNNDLPTAIKQWDAAITIDPNRPEAHAQIGRALYLVSEQMADKTAQAKVVAQARAALDKAIAVGPTYLDAFFFRGIVLGGLQDYANAQADLQTYLAGSPNGQYNDLARSALAQVTAALAKGSTTVPTTTP
ncbi:MAG: tetratricopeptide repeat protein [Acidimicrobiia bacterium]